MDPLDPDDFDELVSEALDELPDGITEFFDNVVILVEDENGDEPDILGLYEGVPLTERGEYGALELPDRISIYRQPLCACVATVEELRREIKVTVVHEFAHHLGIDDARLAELGWD